MKFFIPDVNDAEKAEQVYEGIKKFAVQNVGGPISNRRIRTITFYDRERPAHKKGYVTATVGQREPVDGLEPVFAILESNMYLVCTPNRGVLRGIPYLVGKNEVTAVEDFET